MYPFPDGMNAFAKNQWYIAAWSDEVKSDTVLERWILGKRTVFFRSQDGKPAALDGLCPHRQFPLAKGTVQENTLVCAYHGFTFATDGSCVRIPTQTHIPANCKLHAYPLVEKWKWIWIWPGDPALADESLIPDHHEIGLTDPDWQPVQAFNIDLKARYQILHENLLDLSHLTFLHQSIIGSDEIASTDAAITEGKGYMRNSRVMTDIEANPFFVQIANLENRIDRTLTIDYYYPSLHVGWERFDRPNHAGDDAHCVGQFKVYHGVTPATEHVTNYFFAHSRTFAKDNAEIGAMMTGGLRMVLQQDEDALEELERVYASEPSLKPDVLAKGDAAAIRGRRTMEQLIRREMQD